jgi:hypothetical protein
MALPPTAEDLYTQELKEILTGQVAPRLRELADHVERCAEEVDRVIAIPGSLNSHSAVAARVVHGITTTLMNVDLGAVIRAAGNADQARASKKTPQ